MRPAFVVAFVLALAGCDEIAGIAPHELTDGGASGEGSSAESSSGNGDINPGLTLDAGPE